MSSQLTDGLSLVTQAAFLCNNRQELLLVKLPDNRWQLPGGKVKHNEPWQEALKREIAEETLITDIKVHQPLYIDNWHTTTHNYYRAYFLCTTLQREVTLSESHIAYEWISPETDLAQRTFTHATLRKHIARFFHDYVR